MRFAGTFKKGRPRSSYNVPSRNDGRRWIVRSGVYVGPRLFRLDERPSDEVRDAIVHSKVLGNDMIDETRTAALLVASVGVALLLIAGCASSGPNVDRAKTALEQDDYSTALSNIEDALEQDSANTDAYLLKAKILRRIADSNMAPDRYRELFGRAREAEEQALSFDAGLREDVRARRQRVYEQEVERGELAYNRATKNDREEDYRRAVAFFGAAGVTEPDSAGPVLNEAFARLRLGERGAAIPVMEKYVERVDTASRKAYRILGRLYLGDQTQKAVDLLDRATQLHPEDQELQALRLNAYNRAGIAEQALEAYRDQIQKNPNNATYRYNYGALLLEAERYTDAIAQLDSAIALRPGHVGSQYNLGAAYVNAALARDDSIAALEGGGASTADTVSTEDRIDALVQKREGFFEKAIPPLERVRTMSTAGSPLRQDACRALMVAYVQTNRPNRAAQVEACTGFTKPDS
jgi:Tfp pilus assembly protein PilF